MTKLPGLSCVVVCVNKFTRLGRTPTRVHTDGRTDGHDNSIYRASISSRGNY